MTLFFSLLPPTTISLQSPTPTLVSSTQPAMRRNIETGLSSAISTIPLPTSESTASVAVQDLRAVGSYNWIDSSKATIVVPGGAPFWTEPRLPLRVKADVPSSFIDQNTHRLFPLDLNALVPIFNTIHLLDPKFNFSALDIVTDRNNFRKLLRWIEGDDDLKPFRIDAELGGKGTMCLTRWEEDTIDSSSGFKGFGHEFEKATTKGVPGCGSSPGHHHRIVNYKLGGLNLLVRFEADAQLPTKTSAKPYDPDDDIASLLSSLSVSSTKPTSTPTPTPFPTHPALSYILQPSTTLTPQNSIVELKTRSHRSAFGVNSTFPQLFFSQTQHLFLAKHDRGTFISIEKHQLGQGVFNAEEARAERGLKRLVGVLQQMREIVIREGLKGEGVAFVFSYGGRLKVHRLGGAERKRLGKEVDALFAGRA